MANALYGKYKARLLDATVDFISNNIKLVLVDAADYTVAISTHEFLSDVAAGGRVATSGNLAGKSNTLGVANATSPITWTAVTGDPSEAAILYEDSGSAATSPLMVYYDTASSGLPVTPNGGDINFVIDSGANKLFAL